MQSKGLIGSQDKTSKPWASSNNELVERIEKIAAKSVALAAGPTAVPPSPSESVLAMTIQNKNLDGTPLSFYEILDLYFKDDGQLEFLSN